nr:hypothetical protein [Caldilineaceae bacterium]
AATSQLPAEESWRPIRCFLRQWAEPATLLHQQSPMVWLEFDRVNQAWPVVPLPGVCFCLDSDYVEKQPHEAQRNPLSRERYRALFTAALAILYGQPISATVQRHLLACYDHLPASGRLIHLSAMLGRQPPALKVYAAVARDDLLTYLSQIGWPGSDAELGAMLAEFYADLSLVFVDLTIEECIAPRIGLAYSQVHLKNRGRADARWTSLLDRCVATGCCTAEKRAALLTWPGSTRQPWPGRTWPVRLSRWLDLKLVYQPGQPLQVKGYLGFMQTFSLF